MASKTERIPYWALTPDLQRKSMSVMEMRELLGLGRTDAYWLLHKNNFDVYEIDGNYRIDIESFEKWYANQAYYCKVNGPPPGSELKKISYSISDIAEMLQLSKARVYELFQRDQVETVLDGHVRRVPKETFEEWYRNHPRYRTLEDRKKDQELEESSIWLPDVARLLGIGREEAYNLIRFKSTRDYFEIIEVAKRKRVTKESFYSWYNNQSDYCIQTKENSDDEIIPKACEPKNPRFYTIDEIASFFGFRRDTIAAWIKKGFFPVIKIGKTYRIPREGFDTWFRTSKKKAGGKKYGIDCKT